MNMLSIIKHSFRDLRSAFALIIKVISLSFAQYFSSSMLSVYAIQAWTVTLSFFRRGV